MQDIRQSWPDQGTYKRVSQVLEHIRQPGTDSETFKTVDAMKEEKEGDRGATRGRRGASSCRCAMQHIRQSGQNIRQSEQHMQHIRQSGPDHGTYKTVRAKFRNI